MNYEEMSDFEINKLVATHESLIINEGQSTSKQPTAVMVNDIVQSFMFDPCNNPSDAWPIIVDNCINIEFYKDRVKSCVEIKTRHGVEFINSYNKDKSPLRAAMICFLKMKDAEK